MFSFYDSGFISISKDFNKDLCYKYQLKFYDLFIVSTKFFLQCNVLLSCNKYFDNMPLSLSIE